MKKFHFDLIVSSVVLVAMIVVILIQIIFRLMGNPLSWTEEVARWMLVWATFAGASYAFKNGGLIRVDFFVKKLFKKKGRRITDIAAMMFRREDKIAHYRLPLTGTFFFLLNAVIETVTHQMSQWVDNAFDQALIQLGRAATKS